jgi:hypothetical protein
LVVAGAAKTGRPWTNVQHYKRWIEEIGFENVVEKTYYLPTNPWAKGRYFKDIAVLWHKDITSGLEGISLKVLGNLGWSVDEIHVFLAAVRDDFQEPEHSLLHAYISVSSFPALPYCLAPDQAQEGCSRTEARGCLLVKTQAHAQTFQ